MRIATISAICLSDAATLAPATISAMPHHGRVARRKRITIHQITGTSLSQAMMLVTSHSQICAVVTGTWAAALSLSIEVALAIMITIRITTKPAPSSSASRRCAPFIPRHPPLVPVPVAIVPPKPLLAPLRYRASAPPASHDSSITPSPFGLGLSKPCSSLPRKKNGPSTSAGRTGGNSEEQTMQRHYGMDWLRIGAFAQLIIYHIGMVIVPWGFHVKTAHPTAWVEIPMLFTNPWRLSLLLVVSGFASRALLSKAPGLGGFLKRRSARLLIPLAFGMAVVVPPQTWVELVGKHGYGHGLLWFWTHDYFRFGTLFGIVMPTWNHLWFVTYLWVYTLALCLLALLPGTNRLQPAFDRLFAGSRALWVPLAFLLVTQFWLFHRAAAT